MSESYVKWTVKWRQMACAGIDSVYSKKWNKHIIYLHTYIYKLYRTHLQPELFKTIHQHQYNIVAITLVIIIIIFCQGLNAATQYNRTDNRKLLLIIIVKVRNRCSAAANNALDSKS